MDRLTKEQRSKNMQAIKSKGTKIELLLANALWSSGYRYRKNNDSIFGKPDFTLRKRKIAIFCDSEFFHGKDWELNKLNIRSNVEFWHKKIESNIERDKLVNDTLLKNGWQVIRFWGEDIKKNIDFCLNRIKELIDKSDEGKVL